VKRLLGIAAAGYALVAATFLTPSTSLSAYADGAPPGFTGGFGESSCDACHFEHDINAKPGQLTVTGVPERYTPGAHYTLTITLVRPEMKIGGFQLAARMDGSGAQAGTLAPASGEEKRVAIDSASGIQYARQRREGAEPAPPGLVRWEVAWTAPAVPGAVQFDVAANAGDGDDAARGDYVYTAAARTTVAGP
jgi:hypothetical protein